MRRTACFFTALALLGSATLILAQDGGKPKHDIKTVMTTAHKDGLLKKVLEGTSTDQDKAQLLDLYISLAENDPPRGDDASWNAKTRAAVLAAGKVVVGRDGAMDQLKAATNCMACHSVHKPPQ